jgi:2,5-diamino-6-(ribosylamino)-4(3H)-pyrimidinone 5'-phosphate reductase
VRPYVTVNCAASVDGKIATAGRRQTRLSSPEDLERVRALRAESDAIMVGIGTVLADDPGLAAPAGAAKAPLRVVVDSQGRTPPGAKVFDGRAPTLIATARGCDPHAPNAEVRAYGEGRVDLAALLDDLGARGVRKLMVEGGGELIFSLFERGLVDELFVFVADLLIGGASAPTVADGAGFAGLPQAARLEYVDSKRLGAGTLLRYKVAAKA